MAYRELAVSTLAGWGMLAKLAYEEKRKEK